MCVRATREAAAAAPHRFLPGRRYDSSHTELSNGTPPAPLLSKVLWSCGRSFLNLSFLSPGGMHFKCKARQAGRGWLAEGVCVWLCGCVCRGASCCQKSESRHCLTEICAGVVCQHRGGRGGVGGGAVLLSSLGLYVSLCVYLPVLDGAEDARWALSSCLCWCQRHCAFCVLGCQVGRNGEALHSLVGLPRGELLLRRNVLPSGRVLAEPRGGARGGVRVRCAVLGDAGRDQVCAKPANTIGRAPP